MNWCCLTFKSWYHAAGERGIAILIDRGATGKAEFVIQQRAIDKDINSRPVTDYPIALVSEVHIAHCPWCGRKLEKWYGKVVDQLARPELRIDRDS
jgi:hypothetical protein